MAIDYRTSTGNSVHLSGSSSTTTTTFIDDLDVLPRRYIKQEQEAQNKLTPKNNVSFEELRNIKKTFPEIQKKIEKCGISIEEFAYAENTAEYVLINNKEATSSNFKMGDKVLVLSKRILQQHIGIRPSVNNNMLNLEFTILTIRERVTGNAYYVFENEYAWSDQMLFYRKIENHSGEKT